MPAIKDVDNTDWLKTIAIILVAVDHFGYFFVEDVAWWSVYGRLAAPPFFFLMGYAQTRSVPHYWIWIGLMLTLLDSVNNDWTWVAPNILLSFALIRIARPHVQTIVRNYEFIALGILIATLIVTLPYASLMVDYGAEGWLWALFGLCQRMYIDGSIGTRVDGRAQLSAPPEQANTEKAGLMRLLACMAAAGIYVWQEQIEFTFSQDQFIVFVLGLSVLSLGLFLFQRGPSRLQPPETINNVLRFIGRRTLEIYAIQLGGSELIIMLIPDLAA